MRALFFAEGGPEVGLGHLRRCSALADALRGRGWACEFLVREPAARDWLAAAGQKAALARAEPGALPEADYAADAFVIDSYPVGNEQVRAKAAGAGLVAAFDDLLARSPVADVVIHSGAGLAAAAPQAAGGTLALLGPEYHALPAEYLPLAPRRLRPAVATVLVTLGGAYGGPAAFPILEVVRAAFPEATIDWATGPFAPPAEPPPLPGLRHHPRCGSIRTLLLASDLAVTAAGQTLFEAAATGTPVVALGLAENQRFGLQALERAGVAVSAGFVSEPGFADALRRSLTRAAALATREGLSRNGQRLVDGRGAARIAEAIERRLAEKRARRRP